MSVEDILVVSEKLCPDVKKIIISKSPDVKVDHEKLLNAKGVSISTISTETSSLDLFVSARMLCPGLQTLGVNDVIIDIPDINSAHEITASDMLTVIKFDFSVSVSLHDLMTLTHWCPQVKIFKIEQIRIAQELKVKCIGLTLANNYSK